MRPAVGGRIPPSGLEKPAMSPKDQERRSINEALKALRASRRSTIEAATERMKAQKKAITAIRDALEDGPRTVPEIADAAGIDPATVLWHIATLKKYGDVLEDQKVGAYFRYRLKPSAGDTGTVPEDPVESSE